MSELPLPVEWMRSANGRRWHALGVGCPSEGRIMRHHGPVEILTTRQLAQRDKRLCAMCRARVEAELGE